MNEAFKQDYYRMTGTSYRFGIRSMIQLIFSHQIRYMYWWRKAHKRMTVFRRCKLVRYSRKYGLEIAATAEIGRGLYLGHPYNITVSGGAKIGDNCNLHKGCTIGHVFRGEREGDPTIGSQVSVGINATVVGKITIGNDVMISPGALVNFDVPDHSVVIGNPGVIHHKDEATKDYIGLLV